MVAGPYRILRFFVRDSSTHRGQAGRRGRGMSRECVGRVIVIEREQNLSSFIETGERLDAEVSHPVAVAVQQAESAARRGVHRRPAGGRRQRQLTTAAPAGPR